jgi:uncharacterized protein with FMN-binding domain
MMSTGKLGFSCFNCGNTSKPLLPGIDKSLITTSQSEDVTLVTKDSASSTSTTKAVATTTATKTSKPVATKKATPAATKTSSGTTATASATPTAAATTAAPAAKSGTFTGPAVFVNYGTVQVKITVTNGRITDAVAVQAPSGRNDRYTQMAVPILKQQTLAAQSANIKGASGASYTSYGWFKSLQGALADAGL